MNSIIRRGTAVILTVAACALDRGLRRFLISIRVLRDLSSRFRAPRLPRWKSSTPRRPPPTVIRTYKKEAELEIWK